MGDCRCPPYRWPSFVLAKPARAPTRHRDTTLSFGREVSHAQIEPVESKIILDLIRTKARVHPVVLALPPPPPAGG